MKIYNASSGIVVEHDGLFFRSNTTDWDVYINRDALFDLVLNEIRLLRPDPALKEVVAHRLLPPVKNQEIWAAGVTYLRSREARMDESKASGGGDFYARVYEAERPELFFKSTAARAVGQGGKVRIRRDSYWNVPEPELTLFCTSSGKIAGYTIGNDMSSRDIEGENPLYLPQAKTYDASAALGPGLLVLPTPIDPDTEISLTIKRGAAEVFGGAVSLNRMKRGLTELVGWLFRETSFPNGVFLMTGTGLVPPDTVTLLPGDEIHIGIEGIGVLVNFVERC
jgi:2-dehydro-3-deoxy-D-arabinonate dehydratase